MRRKKNDKPVRNSQHDSGEHYIAESYIHYGPLPSPETLRKYRDTAGPEAVTLILKMAEHEQSFRIDYNKKEQEAVHSLQSKDQEATIKYFCRGQIFGVLTAFGGFTASILLAYFKAYASSIVGGATLATIVTAFIYGTRRINSQKQDK
jgi:uncharacterized membrane protein